MVSSPTVLLLVLVQMLLLGRHLPFAPSNKVPYVFGTSLCNPQLPSAGLAPAEWSRWVLLQFALALVVDEQEPHASVCS